MPKYIDADKLLADLQEELSYHPMIYTEEQNAWFDNGLKRVVRIVKSYQSADVVPRSDVAREIFEKIITTAFSKMPSDVLMVVRDYDFTDGIRMGKREAIIDMINILAELKMKYTEDQK